MASSQSASAPRSPAPALPARPKARARRPAAKLPQAAPAQRTNSAQTAPPSRLRPGFTAPQLLRQFHRLLPVSLLAGWLARSDKVFYQRAFTPLITGWYCVFQRLSDNHHLSHVVEDALAGGADRLSPRGKPLSRCLFSEA